MKLSVIIVNYNVKYFLAQCLLSVEKAKAEYEKKYGKDLIEIFVVDNNSSDNSCDYIKSRFQNIKLIENKKNVGFSAANNQAICQSSGEYVLLLNPDTIIPEDTFLKIIQFADKTPDAGGIGVKMIDGKGNFLPESKRAFPSPEVSFYKMFGLSKLFPKSEKFGKYHLTYLSLNEIHKVDVLSGAFMFLRKSALDKSGLLDEDFFMYGEDIDLSYRITQQNYSNYYFPEVKIIHYKGESTKKGSLNYVFVFYNAMIIFAKKHFRNKKALLFSFLIKLAVIFRATLSAFKRIFNKTFLPLADAFIIFSGFYIIKPYWELYKFNHIGHYPPEYLHYAVPFYIFIWLSAMLFSGAYRTPVDSKLLFKGILAGTFIVLVIYSLLNEEYRYSRMLLLLGTAWTMFFSWLIRAVFTLLRYEPFAFRKNNKSNILIVSEQLECEEIRKMLSDFSVNFSNFQHSEKFETIKNISVQKISHIVISSEKVSFSDFIKTVEKNRNIETAVCYFKERNIIFSSDVITSGDVFSELKFNLNSKNINFKKRLFDILISAFMLLFFPLLILLVEHKKYLLNNIISVLIGKYTWIGYFNCDYLSVFPELKKGVLKPVLYPVVDEQEKCLINARYIRNYHFTDDFYLLYKSFSEIGNKKL